MCRFCAQLAFGFDIFHPASFMPSQLGIGITQCVCMGKKQLKSLSYPEWATVNQQERTIQAKSEAISAAL